MSLTYTKTILIPLVIAFFILSALNPLMNKAKEKFKIPKGITALIFFIFLTVLTVAMTILVINSIEDFVKGADVYKQRLFLFVEQVMDFVNFLGYSVDSKQLLAQIRDLPIFSVAKLFTGNLINFLSSTTLVIIFLLFLLLGSSKKSLNNSFLREVNSKVSKYLFTKFLTSISTAVIVFTVLAFSRIELAFIFGILTFLLNFIPSIGSLIATFLPLPILFLNFGVGWQTWVLLGGMGSVQFIIGNIIEPKLMGEGLDLHPITILVFLLFWGLVWGLPGMFMAAPITAIMKIILGKIELTQPVAEVMAGRPEILFSK